MPLHITYDDAGRINGHYSGPDRYLEVVEPPNPDLYFVDNGELRERPVLTPLPVWTVNGAAVQAIPADGVSTAVLSGLPNPTVVTITGPRGGQVTVVDGELMFAANIPGRYMFAVDPFPCRSFEVYIDAI